jgi:hypothetical protein
LTRETRRPEEDDVKSRIVFVAMAAGWVGAAAAFAQAEPVLQGKDAYGDWQADKPGTVRLIRPQDLVRPGATKSVASSSRVVPRPPQAALQVPAGFKIELFADEGQHRPCPPRGGGWQGRDQ